MAMLLIACSRTIDTKTPATPSSETPPPSADVPVNVPSPANIPNSVSPAVAYSRCEAVTDPQFKELCLGGAAIDTNDIDKCSTFSKMVRLSCVTGIASRRKNSSLCDKLPKEDADLCRMAFQNQP